MKADLLQAIAEVSAIRNEYSLQFPEMVELTNHYFLDFWDTTHYNDWLHERKK